MKRKKPVKVEERPIYPHSEYIAQIYEAMGERKITEAEARTVLNARIFESVIETWLPELRGMVRGMTPGEPDFENTQIVIAQAATMAQAVAMEIILAQRQEQKVRSATDGEIERILHSVKQP